MKDYKISVKKLTDVDLMRDACDMTFIGKSHQSLQSIYKTEHSPVRTQLFWVKLEGIPLYISTHLLRHHVGSVPFQLSCRTDRKGGNPGLVPKIDAIKEKLKKLLDEFTPLDQVVDDLTEELSWLQENSDRYTPVNLGLLLNAQSLIDMSKLRLCLQAAPETRKVFNDLRAEIAKVDPELASMMVRKCVYRGGLCGEARCCGFNQTNEFKFEMRNYASWFSEKQRGQYLQSI